MNRDQALAKIKKCLALGRSANEHEAAAAMRQAQKLMAEHGLGDVDVELAAVAEQSTPMRSAGLNRWEAVLATLVADAFGCVVIAVKHFQVANRADGRLMRARREFVFVGVDAAAQIACYAYDVLSRQCAKARLEHIRRQPKACKPITKTARGDAFAIGWVHAVHDLVERFAGREKVKPLLERYLQAHHPHLVDAKPRNTAVGRNAGWNDHHAGFQAGSEAQLDRALGADARPRLGTRT